MKPAEVRGYVLALSLAGFSTAWAAAAHEVKPPAADPQAQAAIKKQSQTLAKYEAQLVRRKREVAKTIAQRRALARKPRPVRYVRVYVGGGTRSSSGGGSVRSSGGGGSSNGGGGGYTPVSVAPVASSGSS